MKLFLIALLMFSSVAQARQYIQCAHYDSWDRAVINLDGKMSTLFMTDGAHNPDELRVLKKLFFVSNDGTTASFETKEGDVKEIVHIPAEVIGVYASSFEVKMEMISIASGYKAEFPMSCFSAIYED